MKNLAKIFMAVVAGVLTLSCVTDTTEDLGVNLGEGQTTTISIALDDESRTYIDEKNGEEYPMYWSEGDKISINGTESQKAVINSDEPTKASFVVAGVQQTPYCIAYPAAPAGQVKFAAEQTHKNNSTFGDGVTTMYGYGESGNLTLKSLTGILKIGVTGSATLKMAQISTIDRAPIAGAFDFDFEKGEIVKAAADAKDVITYSFGEGVKLSNEPTYMHIAVPAGVYDELYVTLYDSEGGVMYATVKAYKNDETDKSLKVGTIREFQSPIPYTPNDSVFVINDKASLKEFAEQAATLTKDVIFVADVDMTDEAWTPIEGYTKTINGNGYAIEGLSAPLFGTTSASIKGLHLRDVNINETVNPNVGAFARQITATDTVAPVVEHCSVSGKIVVNCQSFAPTTEENVGVAGLVGRANGTSVYSCSNNAVLNILQLTEKNSTPSTANTATDIYIGGVVGYTQIHTCADETAIYPSCVDCENLAKISCVSTSYTGTFDLEGNNGNHSGINIYIGGVLGQNSAGDSNTIFSDLVNRGDITSQTSNYLVMVGGVIGQSLHSISDVQNYGTLSITDTDAIRVMYGGIVGCGQTGTISKATNHNSLQMKNTGGRDVFIGGVVGFLKCVIDDSANNGAMDIHCNMPSRTAVFGTGHPLAIGGIVGNTNTATCTVTNCTTGEDATISVSGTLNNVNQLIGQFGVGGIVGVSNSNILASTNNATINIDATVTPLEGHAGTAGLHVGGIAGSNTVKNNAAGVTNNGDININGGVYASVFHVGGIVGYGYQRISGSTSANNGDITICNNKEGKTVEFQADAYISGGTGYMVNDHAADVVNNGCITINDGATFEGTSYIGGVVGRADKQTVRNTNTETATMTINGTFDGIVNLGGVTAYVTASSGAAGENSAGINIGGTFNANSYVGGVFGQLNSIPKAVTSVKNYGNINYKSSAKVNAQLCVGGLVGNIDGAGNHNNEYYVENLENNGKLSFEKNSEFAATVFAGGLIGYGKGPRMINIQNNGAIEVSGKFNARLCVGGIIGCNTTMFVNDGTEVAAVNNATGTISITADAICSKELFAGGIVGFFRGSVRYGRVSKATNHANISIAGKHTVERFEIGGVIGWMYNETSACADNTNNGKITIAEGANISTTTSLYIGGGIGYSQDTVSGLTNTGAVEINENAELSTTNTNGFMIAGGIGQARAGTSNVVNSGDVLVDVDGDGYIAGGIAYIKEGIAVEGVRAFCNVRAINYSHVGMITGTARDAANPFINCYLGGSICTSTTAEGEAARPNTKTLDATNYFNYIYSSADWTGVEGYDGCKYISAIDAEPAN